MSLLEDVQTQLAGDDDLSALATGGILTTDDVGRLGINRTNNAVSFDSRGRILPTVLIKLREAIPDYAAADDILQAVSVRQVVECWLYQDTGHGTIDAMAERIYAALQGKRLTGIGFMHWAGNVRPPVRDTELDASLERCDYRVYFMQKV